MIDVNMNELIDFLYILLSNEEISLQTKEEVWKVWESYLIWKKIKAED